MKASLRASLLRLVRSQALFAGLLGALFMVAGLSAAIAAWLAGFIAVIANSLFVVILREPRFVASWGVLVGFFCLAEIVKLLLAAVCLAVAVVVFAVSALPLLLAYVILQWILWPLGMVRVSRGFL